MADSSAKLARPLGQTSTAPARSRARSARRSPAASLRSTARQCVRAVLGETAEACADAGRGESAQQEHEHVRFSVGEPGGGDRIGRRQVREAWPAGGRREAHHHVGTAVRAVRREQAGGAGAVADDQRRGQTGRRAPRLRAGAAAVVRLLERDEDGRGRESRATGARAVGHAKAERLRRRDHEQPRQRVRLEDERWLRARKIRSRGALGRDSCGFLADARGARPPRGRPGRRPAEAGRRPPWGGGGWGIRRSSDHHAQAGRQPGSVPRSPTTRTPGDPWLTPALDRRGCGGRDVDQECCQGARRDARLSSARETPRVASPSPPHRFGPPGTSALIAACAGRAGSR